MSNKEVRGPSLFLENCEPKLYGEVVNKSGTLWWGWG